MKPFFTYFGGKYRAAPRYPVPQYSTIIEPFAGSAGYALRYPDRNVVLIDKYPAITETWRYLIGASESEVLELPDLLPGQSVSDLDVPMGARYLIGFWLNKGASGPCKVPSAWMRGGTRPNSYWGPAIRARIASQLRGIRHWRAYSGSYEDLSASALEATWFVDPPYQTAGKDYKHGSKSIDFAHLGAWCATLKGQVIVCENEGANWLPFRPFADIRGTPGAGRSGVSKEVIWTGPGCG